jgi:hypothetical protein
VRELALCAALLAACVAATQQEATSAPGAPAVAATAAPVDQAMLATAKDWFHRLQTGDIDHSQLNDSANMSMDADSVKELTAQVAPLGAPSSFVQKAIGSLGGSTEYTYALAFKSGTKITFILLVDGDGKIAGISVQTG